MGIIAQLLLLTRIIYPRINLNGRVREVRFTSDAPRNLLHDHTSVLEAF